MYLKSAFVGYDDSWFLSIDASIVDDHSTDPNTGSVARNNHSEQLPNYDAQKLQDIVAQQYVNEEAPTDIYFDSCHSSKRDLMIKKAEVTHSVKNRSKHQLSRTRNDCEGFNETLESLPAVKQNHKSKKNKTILINGHKFANHTSDDNDQNPLPQVVGSSEKSREYAHNEVSDHPMMESKANVDEPGQISSSNTSDESESKNGRKLKYNLPDEAEIDGKNDKSKYPMDNTAFKVAAQAGSIAEKIRKTEMTIRVMNGVEENRDLVSESSKATSTSEYLPDKKQTPQVVIGSLSTEPYAHLLKTASSGVKKREKKSKFKLSGCPNQVVGLISSRVGDQQDASRESDIATVPSRDIEETSIPNLLETYARERQYESIDKTAESYAPPPVGESCMFLFKHYFSIICMYMRFVCLPRKI